MRLLIKYIGKIVELNYVLIILNMPKSFMKNMNLDVKLFIKSDAGALYSEYEVKSWGVNDKGIEVILI